MRLNCGQCTVRSWTPRDRFSLLENANNRNVWRNLGDRFPHPYTSSDADRWLSYLEEMTDPTHWAIDVGGNAVGGIGVELGELEHIKSGRFGYWLGEPYWGRGIMTSAVQVTSDYVLNRFDIVRLEASVFAWNPASMRVLEKCGFSREGVLRLSVFKDGQIIDAVMYAKLI
jgi:RimJ/RimL family protein N-acetyltransferase